MWPRSVWRTGQLAILNYCSVQTWVRFGFETKISNFECPLALTCARMLVLQQLAERRTDDEMKPEVQRLPSGDKLVHLLQPLLSKADLTKALKLVSALLEEHSQSGAGPPVLPAQTSERA